MIKSHFTINKKKSKNILLRDKNKSQKVVIVVINKKC